MEMHQVRYFLAVCEELNFTRAAEKCHVAQPSLTRAIKLLEEELGGVLFHRERANTHLSELGRLMQPFLQDVHDQAQAAKREARDFGKLEQTPLKLGIMCTIAPTHLLELIGAVQAKHPAIELQIIDASADALHDRLIAGELETAIYCKPMEDPDERLHAIPLFREQYMIVVNPHHRLARQDAVRAADLRGDRYLNRANCEFNPYPVFGEPGVDFEVAYRSERDDWILAMIAAGLGFGFIPEHSISHRGVVAKPLVDPECWREVSLLTVRGRPHSPAVGALVREAMRVKWAGKPALAVEMTRAANLNEERVAAEPA